MWSSYVWYVLSVPLIRLLPSKYHAIHLNWKENDRNQSKINKDQRLYKRKPTQIELPQDILYHVIAFDSFLFWNVKKAKEYPCSVLNCTFWSCTSKAVFLRVACFESPEKFIAISICRKIREIWLTHNKEEETESYPLINEYNFLSQIDFASFSVKLNRHEHLAI